MNKMKNIKKFALYAALIVSIKTFLGAVTGISLSLVSLVGTQNNILVFVLGMIDLTVWLLIADFVVSKTLRKMELN